MTASEIDIRSFAATRLADFKVPRIVLILDEIPRGNGQTAAHLGSRPNSVWDDAHYRFGAGAIGGYLAAKLGMAGRVDLSIVARGAHLDAIRADGLRLIEDGDESLVPIRATARAQELGVQDYVVLALRPIPWRRRLTRSRRCLGRIRPSSPCRMACLVVLPQDGQPAGRHGAAGGRSRRVIWDRLRPDRVIGSVVYPAVEVDAPGLIRHAEECVFRLASRRGEKSGRVMRLAEEMIAAGLQAPVRDDIRSEIWIKLWGNLSFNPISALTGSTLAAIVADEATRALARTMMLEAQTIGESLSVRFPIGVDRRIKGARRRRRTQDLRCCRISSAGGRWRSTRW